MASGPRRQRRQRRLRATQARRSAPTPFVDSLAFDSEPPGPAPPRPFHLSQRDLYAGPAFVRALGGDTSVPSLRAGAPRQHCFREKFKIFNLLYEGKKHEKFWFAKNKGELQLRF